MYTALLSAPNELDTAKELIYALKARRAAKYTVMQLDSIPMVYKSSTTSETSDSWKKMTGWFKNEVTTTSLVGVAAGLVMGITALMTVAIGS